MTGLSRPKGAGARRPLALLALLSSTILPTGALGQTTLGQTTLGQIIAITHARIETVGPAGEITSGTVVIKDGKILAVGAHAGIPSGARVIDAGGQVVTPGFWAPSTNLSASEVEGVAPTRDDTAQGKIGAAYDVSLGVNPASTMIPLARQGGVTRAVVTPVAGRQFGGDRDEQGAFDDVSQFTAGGGDPASPASGLFAGQAAGISLKAGDPDPVFKANAAMVVDLSDDGARVAGSHAGALLMLRNALEDARAYAAHREAFERGQSRSFALSRDDLEALVPVAEGKTPLLALVHRASDIRQLLKLSKTLGVKVIIEGGEEAWLLAPELAGAGVPVLVDTEEDLPEQFESLGARLDNAARLEKAGVVVVIQGSRDFNNLRQVRFNAGTAVANGMSYGGALAAVTLNPARIWGVGDRLGSIEPGKVADLVIWNGDPFETSTYPTAVFIAGAEQPKSTRGLELRDRYAKPADGLPSAYH